ncbi:MAG TPA: hypothetical protein VHZ55_07125 [Bryobacteraceae bacterium]|nr:hypothetical protein [Bryobacteraceae bacterium]
MSPADSIDDLSSSRRQFLQLGSLAAGATVLAAAPATATVINTPFPRLSPKMGIIGTGGRGTELLKNFLGADTEVKALWRRAVHTQRNGNLYPTHGLGPVANYLGINRGDRFDYLVSMSTPARGLAAYRVADIPRNDPKWSENYIDGDMNTSLIKTANGLTVNLQHDVSNPHPYDRLNTIAGTRGVFKDYRPRLYLDGQPGEEEYTTLDSYAKKFQHPLWQREGEIAPDLDVYDAATWSAPAPLSRQSVGQGSAPIPFPDFTRGCWKERKGSPIGKA